jgi:predicted dehydrogenase
MPVRIGICGLGYMGMVYLDKALKMGDVEVSALIEKDRDKLNLLRCRFNIPCYEDYRNIENGIDGVVIASPASTHFEIAKFFLEKGVHVFVEKPLALTYEQAFWLSKIAESKDLKIQVGFLERYNPAFREGVKYLEDPIFFEARRIGPYPQRSIDVDVVLDLMIHDLDLLSFIKKERVVSIDAGGVNFIGEGFDEAFAVLKFEDSTKGIFIASRISSQRERSLRIIEEERIVNIDFLNVRLSIQSKKLGSTDTKIFECEKKDLVKEELEDFILYIKGEGEPLTKARDTLSALYLAEKIKEAIGNS